MHIFVANAYFVRIKTQLLAQFGAGMVLGVAANHVVSSERGRDGMRQLAICCTTNASGACVCDANHWRLAIPTALAMNQRVDVLCEVVLFENQVHSLRPTRARRVGRHSAGIPVEVEAPACRLRDNGECKAR